MVYVSAKNQGLGVPIPGTVDDAALVPVGTIERFIDDVRGDGEYIYLPGVASTVLGDAVLYDLNPAGASTTRHTNATGSNSGRPIAIATAAVVAGKFGWYQVAGLAVVKTLAGTVAGVAMGSATAGTLSNTADAGDQILGARISSAVGTPAAGLSYVTINRPYVQGQIT